ncbi:MAG: DUF4249 domain-containing protein [Dyadobacter sp.]|uniref:DUF4249 domain-containing protein n=1 Tax=Dyadobacter sp. TaxID=1914288 RepID=UPI003267A2C4
MKGRGRLYFLLIVSILVINGCIEPFSPPEVNNVETYLVVDGFLNVGGDSSSIMLRHTQNTNDGKQPVVETGATIWAEAEKGEKYQFTETAMGVYKLPKLSFNTEVKYRLNIKRKGGGEYQSDYVVVSKTPPIDSLTYKVDTRRNAMLIYVNAHDQTNSTRFYRWKFEETYEYRAAYYSGLDRDRENKIVIARKEDVNLCWRTLESKDIKLGSTIKLNADIIQDLPVNIVDIASNKLYFGYSILVKQYALSREAFEYWTDLAKTTQGTGSLFDPQPSQVTGNIKNKANNKELVFGYFSAAVEQKQRIFIREQLGASPRCIAPDTIEPADAYKSEAILLNTFRDAKGRELVLGSSEICADCRVQGGTTTRPSFWE